jgi:peptidoglycan/LPS O-acetylase OafA/YrhL
MMMIGPLGGATRQTSLDDRLLATRYRGPGFDQVRLLAATTVLLHHSRGIEYDAERDPLFTYSGGFVHFGLLAVLVFFAISGFLVTPGLVRSGSLVDYATNRVLRVAPALIAVVLVSMVMLGPVLTALSPTAYFSDPELYLYAKNILTLTYNHLPGVTSEGGQPVIINGALWTLHFEALCYLALAGMSMFGVLRSHRAVLTLFAATYAFYVAFVFIPPLPALFPGRFVTFVNLFAYFAAGVTLYTFRSRVPYSAGLAAVAFGLLMLALPLGLGAAVAPLCVPYIVIFVGLSALPGRALVKRDLSYGVYLIHAPVSVAFILLYPGVRPWWAFAAGVFIMTLLLSYLSWTFVESPALARKKAVASWAGDRLSTLRRSVDRWRGRAPSQRTSA